MLDYINLWNTCSSLVKTQKLVENDVLRARYAAGGAKVSEVDNFFIDVFFKAGNAIAKVDTKGEVTEDLNGKRPVSTELALMLEALWGIDAHIWLKLQANYNMGSKRKDKAFMQHLQELKNMAAASLL